MFAVETVLKVEFGFSNQIIGSHQVPVINWHGECGIHWECGLHVKGSDTMSYMLFEMRVRWDFVLIEISLGHNIFCYNIQNTYRAVLTVHAQTGTNQQIVHCQSNNICIVHTHAVGVEQSDEHIIIIKCTCLQIKHSVTEVRLWIAFHLGL